MTPFSEIRFSLGGIIGIWLGVALYQKTIRRQSKRWKREIPNQIALARKKNKVAGNIFFSSKSLMQKNNDVVRILKKNFYKQKALTPTSPLGQQKKNNGFKLISQTITKDSIHLKFNSLKNQKYVLIYKSNQEPLSNYPMNKLVLKKFLNGRDSFSISKNDIQRKKQIAITLLDKFGQESNPLMIDTKQTK